MTYHGRAAQLFIMLIARGSAADKAYSLFPIVIECHRDVYIRTKGKLFEAPRYD